MSSAIFNALPGTEVPVSAIAKRLAQMWVDTADAGGVAPSSDDARATQVNFVLHLGLNTTPADAAAQFALVEKFSQRYPSRIVVLCPLEHDEGVTEISAKIHGECFLGKSKGDKRCVEFVMLSYPRAAREYLENQVSICLSTDLPLYYWAHGFAVSAHLADYRYLLSQAKRVLIDSSIAPADAFTYPWPNPKALRDLVYSRLLPVRQTIGQFLAAYPPATLAAGLRGVTVAHAPALAAEGRVTLNWLSRRLADCDVPDNALALTYAPLASGEKGSLTVRFDYADSAKFFRWSGDFTTGHARFEANLGTGNTTLAATASLLPPANALSEAMFF